MTSFSIGVTLRLGHLTVQLSADLLVARRSQWRQRLVGGRRVYRQVGGRCARRGRRLRWRGWRLRRRGRRGRRLRRRLRLLPAPPWCRWYVPVPREGYTVAVAVISSSRCCRRCCRRCRARRSVPVPRVRCPVTVYTGRPRPAAGETRCVQGGRKDVSQFETAADQQRRRHEVLIGGGGYLWAPKPTYTQTFRFSSDFVHFALKILENAKF